MNSPVLYAYLVGQREIGLTPLVRDEAGNFMNDQDDPLISWDALRSELVCRIYEDRSVTVIYAADDPSTTLDPGILKADIEFDLEGQYKCWWWTKKYVSKNRAAYIENCPRELLRAIADGPCFQFGGLVDLATIPITDIERLQRFLQGFKVEYWERSKTSEECLFCMDDAHSLKWLNPCITDPSALRRLLEPTCTESGYELHIEERDERVFKWP